MSSAVKYVYTDIDDAVKLSISKYLINLVVLSTI